MATSPGLFLLLSGLQRHAFRGTPSEARLQRQALNERAREAWCGR